MLRRLRFWQSHSVEPWTPTPRTERSTSVPAPRRARAGRKVAIGARGHNSALLRDPNDGLVKALESRIERDLFMTWCADPKVESIEVQSDAIEFADQYGEIYHHHFDFVVTMRDGRRFAVLAKSAERIRMPTKSAEWLKGRRSTKKHWDIEELAELLARQLPPGFVDEVVVLSEEEMQAWQIANARLIHSCRLEGHRLIDDDIAELAEKANGPIAIADLCAPFAHRGIRSVARLLFNGRLAQIAPGRIDASTMVVATGAC